MTAVTECAFGAVFAAAEVNGAVFFCFVGGGRETGAFMGAVTERLAFALSAGTPVVGFTSFDDNRERGFLGNNGFAHRISDG